MEAGRIGERQENLSEKGRREGNATGAPLVGSAIHDCWTTAQKILLDTGRPSHGSRDRKGADAAHAIKLPESVVISALPLSLMVAAL